MNVLLILLLNIGLIQSAEVIEYAIAVSKQLGYICNNETIIHIETESKTLVIINDSINIHDVLHENYKYNNVFKIKSLEFKEKDLTRVNIVSTCAGAEYRGYLIIRCEDKGCILENKWIIKANH